MSVIFTETKSITVIYVFKSASWTGYWVLHIEYWVLHLRSWARLHRNLVISLWKNEKKKTPPPRSFPQLKPLCESQVMWLSLHFMVVLILQWIWKIGTSFCQWKVNLLRARIQLTRHKLHKIEKDARWKQEDNMTKDIYVKCVINVLEML